MRVAPGTVRRLISQSLHSTSFPLIPSPPHSSPSTLRSPPPFPLPLQYKLHLPSRADSYQVVFPREAVEKEELDVMEKLEEFTPEQVR